MQRHRKREGRDNGALTDDDLRILGGYKNIVISVWWTPGVYAGWTLKRPREVPIQVVYREQKRKNGTVAVTEQLIFDLQGAPWPRQRKLWEELAHKFLERTCMRLLHVWRWVDANKPQKEV